MKRLVCAMLLLAAMPASAGPDPAPYAGQDARAIKALSADEIADYLNGRGMGLAKAAELNHYPGPRHVIDLSESLGLSDAELAASKAIYARMLDAAVALGTELVAKERELDRAFAAGGLSPERLDELVRGIADVHGRLRSVHLQAHLEQREVLTEKQILEYDRMRGYGDAGHAHDRHGHH